MERFTLKGVKGVMKNRTNQQNKALHLFFTQLADQLNSAGLYMKKTLKENVDIPWQPSSIKEYLWRPIQLAATGKESTTELDSKEIDDIYDILNKHLGEKFSVNVAFPSVEELENKQLRRVKHGITDEF